MRSFRPVLWPRRGSSRLRGRAVALNVVLALVAVLVPTSLVPAGATEPDNSVTFTVEGCRNNVGPDVSLPNDDGAFICEDPAYTPGNLGKDWGELDQAYVTDFGGIDRSVYRLVTITQVAGTTCVYDYYGRLALGSHDFPGASLHANLANKALETASMGAGTSRSWSTKSSPRASPRT